MTRYCLDEVKKSKVGGVERFMYYFIVFLLVKNRDKVEIQRGLMFRIRNYLNRRTLRNSLGRVGEKCARVL